MADQIAEITTKFQDVLYTKTPNVVRFSIDWTIPNFTFFKERKGPIYSTSRIFDKCSWNLELHPILRAGERGARSDHVGLYLNLNHEGKDDFEYRLRFKIGVVGKDDTFVYDFTQEHTRVKSSDWSMGEANFLGHHDLWGPRNDPKFLVDDKLTVRVEVDYLSMSLNAGDEIPQVTTEDFHRRGFRTLYETQVGRDFILVSSDGLEMSVHSAVLIAASPVFLAMFEGDFAERQTGRCVMTQVDASVLKVLVQFMYCGSHQTDVSDCTEQVIVVADQYQLTDLVGQCEQVLVKKMAEENVTDLLLLTDSIEAPFLKAHALRYVRKNATVLKEYGAFTKLYENASAKLLSELVSYLLP